MKGMILNEFAEFADSTFAGVRAANGTRPGAGPSRDAGARYAPEAFAALVRDVSDLAGVPVPDVLRRFGVHLFGRFAVLYPVFFLDDVSCLEFLAGLDTTIHGEVRKLHPDAEFPSFACRRDGTDRLDLTYRSRHALADLAEGLLLGSIAYFREPIVLARTDVADGEEHVAVFSLTRAPRVSADDRQA